MTFTNNFKLNNIITKEETIKDNNNKRQETL